MAWLDTYSDTNKIEVKPYSTHSRIVGSYTSGYLVAYNIRETVTEYTWRYTGMNKDAATTCANALYAAHSAVDGKVTIEHQQGGSYDVNLDVYYVVIGQEAVE